MRSIIYIAISALTALAAAQGNNENPFSIPRGGYEFIAGQPTVINWRPTTDGTVTIKLHKGDDITPDSGEVLVTNVANAGSFAFVPPSDLGAGSDYTIQIIDDDDVDNYNFLPRFSIDGATGTVTALTPTVTVTTGSATETATTSDSATTTGTASQTTLISTTSGVSTSSATTSDSSTSTEDATTTSEPTSTSTGGNAPDPNGAMSLTIPGGMLAGVMALMALL
ncbi:hypothetical protein AJ80_04442 [Polytolypa hystricis UAMH7299]|uniref:Yeast cell wall synthesis Kre9/Knh1-like N-terminal domain-containing protein n=1 Tax=Polytolypa hystricis (strain UAMH7299) TaxID=1447883 RepID=A0A2B7YC81_POLH7|nr:hypothetical protein AJ80_04442 [Polytolypa hystricis UAMH7299]